MTCSEEVQAFIITHYASSTMQLLIIWGKSERTVFEQPIEEWEIGELAGVAERANRAEAAILAGTGDLGCD